MALGLYTDRTTRLNLYIYTPGKTPRTIIAETWGGGLLSNRACIVAKDRSSGQIKVLGQIIPKHLLPQDPSKTCTRIKIVEEGLTFADRHEFKFFVEEVDLDSQAIVRQRPFMDPQTLVRYHTKQEFE
jgi:hypothetical protein